MTKDNEQYAYLTVVGDFRPESVTAKLGLEPSEAWKKGGRNERTQLERKFSRWSIDSRLERSASLISINQSKDMNILHGYPVYRADAGAVSPDPSHPEIRWRCSRNIKLSKFGLIAPTHFKLPTTPFPGRFVSRAYLYV
jgi:hypothetical protein